VGEFMEIDDYVKTLSLYRRFRIWLAGFKVRRMLRDGWRPTIQTLCCDCLHPIVEEDDAANVCIECGGRNRRAEQHSCAQSK
jgi:hypothetical protein